MKNRVAAVCRNAWFQLTNRLMTLLRRQGRVSRGSRPGAAASGPSADPLRIPGALAREAQTTASPTEWSSGLPVGPSAGRSPSSLVPYLRSRENRPEEIAKLHHLLQMPRVLLEIGCGAAEAARLIALKNPDLGVIATDLYDGSRAPCDGSHYGRVAALWNDRRLPAQRDTPANLVILRAEADLLRHLPLSAIDTILLINPEPGVGKQVLDLLREEDLLLRIRQGPTRIVILPYSREMGIMACGGCAFEHDSDWSRGLGYILGSGMPFKRCAPVRWGVDLARASAYTGNSTQRDLYVLGDPSE